MILKSDKALHLCIWYLKTSCSVNDSKKCVSKQKKSQTGKLHKNFSKSFWQLDKRNTISVTDTPFFSAVVESKGDANLQAPRSRGTFPVVDIYSHVKRRTATAMFFRFCVCNIQMCPSLMSTVEFYNFLYSTWNTSWAELSTHSVTFIIITAALSYTAHPPISTSKRVYEHFRKSKHKPCACPPRWILKRRQFLKGRKTHPTCASSIFHLLVFSGSASWVSRCDEFGWGWPEIYVSVGTEMRPWTAELITASSQKMWIDVSAPYSHPGSASLIPSVWGAGCECKDCLQIWIKSHFEMAKLVMPLPEIKFHFWITILFKKTSI